MGVVLLSIGSNSGDRRKNILAAAGLLEEEFGKLKKSSVYETAPFYESQKGQENFFNCCVKFSSDLSPDEILKKTQAIEKKLGRKRPYPNAERSMDIDIIFISDDIIAEDHLTVPHPVMQDRRFVLKPLSDIAGSFEHPAIGLSVDDLLFECPDASSVSKIKGFWEE